MARCLGGGFRPGCEVLDPEAGGHVGVAAGDREWPGFHRLIGHVTARPDARVQGNRVYSCRVSGSERSVGGSDARALAHCRVRGRLLGGRVLGAAGHQVWACPGARAVRKPGRGRDGPGRHRGQSRRAACVQRREPYLCPGAVYTVRPDGSKLRRLPLPVALGPDAVAWSPDGTRLAFAADDLPAHQDSNLYVVGADGRGLRQLTHGLLGVSALAWSPDGHWIAFTGFPNYVAAAFVVRATGTGLRRILPRFRVRSLAWGPTGRLAIAGTPSPVLASWLHKQATWTVNVNGSNALRVVGPVTAPPVISSGLAVIAWSPDGRTIAFVVGRAPPRQMYTVSARGGRPHRLDIPGRPANVLGIAWQPVASVRASTRQSSAMRG